MDLFTMIAGIAKQLQPVRESERQIVQTLGNDPNIRSAFSVTELLALIRIWNHRLANALALEIPGEKVIAGFSAAVDKVLIVSDSMEEAYSAWRNGEPEQLRPDLVRDAVRQIEGDIRKLAGGAPGTQTRRERRDHFHEKLDGLFTSDNGVRVLLGGSSAAVVDVLAELGVTARICTPWWPREYSHLASIRAERVVVAQDGQTWSTVPIAEYGDHPSRTSYVLQVQMGDKFQGQTMPRTERQIYGVTEPFRTTVPAILDEPDCAPRPFVSWPSCRRFASVEIRGDCLKIRDASNETIDGIAREHRYVFLGGLPNDALDPALAKQLLAFVRNGCQLHLEISGDFYENYKSDVKWDPVGLEAAQGKLHQFIESLQRVGVQSVGLNDVQLGQLERFGLLGELPSLPPKSSSNVGLKVLIGVGLKFARRLGVDRLYLHTNSADVVFRRNATPSAMRQEIQADLFAKGALLAALFRRHNHKGWGAAISKVAPVLRVEGFRALIEIAFEDKFMLTHGYRVSPCETDYSLAVIPVMWPDSPPAITSSAGDISSGVQYVMAGI